MIEIEDDHHTTEPAEKKLRTADDEKTALLLDETEFVDIGLCWLSVPGTQEAYVWSRRTRRKGRRSTMGPISFEEMLISTKHAPR